MNGCRCQGIVVNVSLKSSKVSSVHPIPLQLLHAVFIVSRVLTSALQGQAGQKATKPIKLFYTSNMPVILLTAAVSNIYFFSQILYKRFPDNRIVALFGSWTTVRFTPTSYLVPIHISASRMPAMCWCYCSLICFRREWSLRASCVLSAASLTW
jgi:preprotein translocase subunit SecY